MVYVVQDQVQAFSVVHGRLDLEQDIGDQELEVDPLLLFKLFPYYTISLHHYITIS